MSICPKDGHVLSHSLAHFALILNIGFNNPVVIVSSVIRCYSAFIDVAVISFCKLKGNSHCEGSDFCNKQVDPYLNRVKAPAAHRL